MEAVNISFYLKTCYAVLLNYILPVTKIIFKLLKNPFGIRQEFGDFHTGFSNKSVSFIVCLHLDTFLSHRIVFSAT